MNLTELRKEIEWCIEQGDETALMWMEKVVEAVDMFMTVPNAWKYKEWQKIKELLKLTENGNVTKR